jgi:pyridoxine 5-phosphate synthase
MDARLHLHLDTVFGIRRLEETARTPDPVAVALMAGLAGVDGLAAQVRDGKTHDFARLRESVSGLLELGLTPAADLVTTAFDLRPDRVTLLPEDWDGGGLLGGLDAHVLKNVLKKHVEHLRDADIEVAVRVEPNLDQIKALHRLGADVAVLFAGGVSTARTRDERRFELTRLKDASMLSARLGMRVAVVGGLDLRAVEITAQLAHVDEFHVGHACFARALLLGIERAVVDFRAAIDRGRRRVS